MVQPDRKEYLLYSDRSKSQHRKWQRNGKDQKNHSRIDVMNNWWLKEKKWKKNSFLPLIWTDSKRKLVLAYESSPFFSYSVFVWLFFSVSKCGLHWFGHFRFTCWSVHFLYHFLVKKWLIHIQATYHHTLNESDWWIKAPFVYTFIFLLPHSTFNWW